MNKERRECIGAITNVLRECSSTLENVKDDEDYAREQIPENLQNTDKYIKSEEASDVLDSAINGLEDVINTLDELS